MFSVFLQFFWSLVSQTARVRSSRALPSVHNCMSAPCNRPYPRCKKKHQRPSSKLTLGIEDKPWKTVKWKHLPCKLLSSKASSKRSSIIGKWTINEEAFFGWRWEFLCHCHVSLPERIISIQQAQTMRFFSNHLGVFLMIAGWVTCSCFCLMRSHLSNKTDRYES